MNLNREIADLQEHHVPLSNSNFPVYEGDCVEILGGMKNGTYDLVVTSPPYPGTVDYIKSQRLSLLWFDHPQDELRKHEIGARFKRDRKGFIDEYLRDMKTAFIQIRRILKTDGYCCVIIGESPQREPTVGAFEGLLKEIGFKHDRSIERKVAVQRRLFPVVKDETIIVVRNSKDG
jgi:DNA modification methylase